MIRKTKINIKQSPYFKLDVRFVFLAVPALNQLPCVCNPTGFVLEILEDMGPQSPCVTLKIMGQ